MAKSTEAARALRLVKRRGLLRLRDARAQGVHPETLRRLLDAGRLVRAGRGVYAPADHASSEHVDLAHAAARVPRGVVCLLSALHYHGIGTQLPHNVWMMIDRRSGKPRVDHPPMRFVLASGACLVEGVQTVRVDGQSVKIFNPAKTVVDCFRYRQQVGLDVAMEALREALRDRRCTPAELARCAAACRVWSVMKPYVEALA